MKHILDAIAVKGLALFPWNGEGEVLFKDMDLFSNA